MLLPCYTDNVLLLDAFNQQLLSLCISYFSESLFNSLLRTAYCFCITGRYYFGKFTVVTCKGFKNIERKRYILINAPMHITKEWKKNSNVKINYLINISKICNLYHFLTPINVIPTYDYLIVRCVRNLKIVIEC